MRIKQNFIDGLFKMKRKICFDGRLIDRTDNLQTNCLNMIGCTCDEAKKPAKAQLVKVVPHLTGERISRFTHTHLNTADLHHKQDMMRLLHRKVGGCCAQTDVKGDREGLSKTIH